MNYLVATIKPWNIEAFLKYTSKLPGQWHLISAPEKLTISFLKQLQPDYIFFPHWNWKVPNEITGQYRCICFHMTDLPFGRGGSPLQNLISLGIKDTQLTALQMTEEIDAGPIYDKCPLSLDGRAEDIYQRAAHLIYQLIEKIIRQNIQPHPQQGEVVYFQRRHPQQSLLPAHSTATQLYDFIRMLDAESYPRAFLQQGSWRLELSEATLKDNGELTAKVLFKQQLEISND